MSGYQAIRLAKLSGKKLEDMFERPKWHGGTESDMFNKLEEIAGKLIILLTQLIGVLLAFLNSVITWNNF